MHDGDTGCELRQNESEAQTWVWSDLSSENSSVRTWKCLAAGVKPLEDGVIRAAFEYGTPDLWLSVNELRTAAAIHPQFKHSRHIWA